MTKVWTSKDPDESLWYTYDWSDDLEAGETIDPVGSSVVAVDANGVTIDEGPEFGVDFIKVRLGHGDEGTEASFTITAKTTLDNEFQDIAILPIYTTLVPLAHPGDYTPPTPAHLLAIFPEFSAVQPSQIQYYLDRAAQSVDESWVEADFAPGRIMLAAHFMTRAGLGSSAEAQAVNDGSSQFKSMAIGSLRLERFEKEQGYSGFSTTRYGKEFCHLLKVNRGGPRVGGFVRGGGGAGDNFGPWTA